MSSRLAGILSRLYQDAGLELLILPVIGLTVLVHLWGTRTNRKIVRQWMAAHAPLLRQEYAQVGFKNRPSPSKDEEGEDSSTGVTDELERSATDDLLKERSAREFITYATGRLNVAFTDIRLVLHRRYNPVAWLAEHVLAIFLDSVSPSAERMEATAFPFDGREAEVVPTGAGGKSSSSSYDGFVWAVVHKDGMKRLREERYDLSLTVTRDHPKLPPWTTVMSENAEITDALLTPALLEAVQAAGDRFQYLIVTDQPLEKPTKVQETTPKKRIYLALHLPGTASSSYESTKGIFSHFLRLPDQLASSAHFRPEVMRKIRQTRDEQINRLQRAEQEEKESERASKRDKEKKEKRDSMLKGLSADEQRKYLEREREKEMRKSQKRMTQRA